MTDNVMDVDDWDVFRENYELWKDKKPDIEYTLKAFDDFKKELSFFKTPKKYREFFKWQHDLIDEKPKSKKIFVTHNYLKNISMNHDECIELAERYKLDKYKPITYGGKSYDRHHVFFIPDYEDAKERLDITERQLRRYLTAFCKNGWLKDMGKSGPRGNKIYAAGYWHYYEGIYIKRWFFTECGEKVLDFTL